MARKRGKVIGIIVADFGMVDSVQGKKNGAIDGGGEYGINCEIYQ